MTDKARRRRGIRTVAAGAAMILYSPGLAAQTAGTAAATGPTTVQQLVLTPGYQVNLARLFAALPSDVFQRCGSLVSNGSQVTVLQPASFDAQGYPVSGLWKQSFPVSGCGNDTVINFFFKGQPGGKILSIAAVPGGTHADLALQHDAYQYVAMAARPSAQHCDALHIRDTVYDGPAVAERAPVGGKAVGRPWHERWSVAACGKVIEVPVTFIPDATGTTISTAMVRPADR